MNQAYRLIWNNRLNAWVVASELARACGKGSRAAVVLLALAASAPLAAADLAAGALPGGGTVAAGQAGIVTSGARMDVTQGSQRAIINWQNFDIGSQAQVNFQQPNSAAVVLNRVSGPTASRIEGQLSANGQVFLVNPNGVLFGGGARVNVGALVASTLNIHDADFMAGNNSFSGSGGTIENRGTINAAPGGYLAFIAPTITNSGTLNAPQGTVAMGAGERVTLNFAGDRLVGLSVSAATIDTLIENRQAIRAEGGAILLTAAGAAAVTNSVVNNSGILEAGSLTEDGGRIVLRAGGDITLAPTSVVAANGARGGEIELQADSGTLLADGRIEARGETATGGTIQLLGERVGLVNAAQVDASGASGGGTVLVGGDYQGKNPEIQNASRIYVGSGATIKADATETGDGGKVVVWADGDTRYYGNISTQGGRLSGNGGLVEVSGKQNLDFNGGIHVGAAYGIGGRVLLDPQDILLSTAVAAPPPNNANGTPDIAFADPPAAGTTNVQISTVTGYSELFLQATRDITLAAASPMTMAAGNSVLFQANRNININSALTVSGAGSINLNAGATLALGAAGTLASQAGGITLSGASITGTATSTISSTGAGNANAGNLNITATGLINLAGAITANGGTATGTNPGRNGGSVTLTGQGITTAAITASGSAGIGANQAGGNAGSISVTNATAGAVALGALTAQTGAATGTGAGGNQGFITVSNSVAGQNLNTGAINTAGNTSGHGGTVTLTSAGDVTVTGTIGTSGAALGAGTTAAGRNAGNVTLTGINRSVTGAITASGAAGLGVDQAGGNAGGVSLTGSGTLGTIGITTQTGAATGVGAGGTAGSITAQGTTVTLGALTTSGGANGNGGAISATASIGLLNVGAITSSGGAANAGVTGPNAGAVALTGDSVTTLGITANGANGNNGAGGIGGNVSVTGTANAVTVGAISTIGGNGVIAAGNAAGGNAGTITLDAGATTPTLTLGGNLTATGGNRVGAAAAGSGGQIWLKDPALLNAAAVTVDAGGGSAGVGVGANVRFDGSIDSTGGARALTVNTNATTIFNGAVGGGAALASLTTNATGTTQINGGSVTTIGVQTYGDALTLGAHTTLTGTTPTFGSTVSGGGFDLALNFSGLTTVNGASFSGIRNLATGNGGTTQLTGAITTTGTQTYNDVVTLTGATTLASGNTAITFNSTVDGGQTLAVNTTAATTFAGNVGGTTALTSVTTNAGGTTAINGGAVTTSGAQTYGDNVTLGAAATTLASTGNAAITLGGTVNGASAMTVNTTGATTFAGAVGGTTALTSLTTNAGGTTAINGGAVSTTGTQTYNDTGTLGAATVLTTSNSNITATGAVNASGNTLTLAAGSGNVSLANAGNNFGTVAVTSGNNVSLTDLNAIILGASNVAGTLDVIAGGAITQSGALAVTGTSSFSAGANAITLNGANDFGGAVSLANAGVAYNVQIHDINNLTLGASTVGGTLTATAGGTITLGGNLTAVGAGDAIVLAAGGNFNNAGAYALNPGSGRFLVWSTSPALDNRGGLAYGFKQYNALFGTTPVNPLASGNGFLYTLAPTITPGLTGTVSKSYDGTPTATLAPGNFTVAGAVDGDTVTLSGSGSYDNRNVGTTKTVTATGITASAVNGAATVYGYAVSPTTASANIGTITAAPLTVTAQTDTKLYDGNAGSAVAPVLTGSTYDAVGTAATQSYDNKNAGTAKTLTASGLLMNDGNGGNNYAVSYVTNTTGVITAASLALNAVTDTRAYDGTTSSSGVVGTAGLVGGDTVSGLTQSYQSKNVLGTNGSTLLVDAGYTVNDGNGGANYAITENTASGTLTAAPLTVTAQTDTKLYDGNAGSTVAPVLTGATYDAVGTAATQSYDNRNAGTAKTLTASGLLMNDGNSGANYAVSYVTNTSGIITAAPLTVTAQTDNRVYDGSAGSAVAPVVTGSTYDAVGTAATQSYDNKNAGTTKTLTASGLLMNDGNGGNNYAISYVTNSTGVITTASLALNAVTDAKVYDGTTSSSGVVNTVGLQGSDNVGSLSQSYLSKNVLGTNGSTLAVNPGYTVNDGNGGTNYTVTENTASGTITPAPLTIAADNTNKLIGTPNPPFSATYTGLVAGETPGSLNGMLNFSTPATLASPAGNYPITPYGQTSGNYLISYVDGVLDVMTPPGGIGPGYDPQAVAAAYSELRFALGTVPAVRYVSDTGEPIAEAPGNRVRIVSGGLKLSR